MIERIATNAGRMPWRKLALAAALLLPANAGGSALAEEASFDASFEHIAVPQPAVEAAPGAVDITTIDTPVEAPGTSLGSGTASYYGRKFNGRRTASGQTFDMNAMTAAHRTLPFGSQVRVTNLANGRSVIVTINDRGPFHGGRLIDVSRAAAVELGLIASGHGSVELELLDQ